MLGSIIGAASSLFAGQSAKKEARRAQEFNAQQADLDRQLQKDFAQQGIRWRVADAKAAGLHPLFALGGNTATYTPSAIPMQADMSMANAISNMGQDVSRALVNTTPKQERAQELANSLSLERGYLENELLRSQIARINSAQVGPGLPSATGETSDAADLAVIHEAARVTRSQPNTGHQEAGEHPETRLVRTRKGYSVVPSQEAIQDQEITNPLMWGWMMRTMGDEPDRSLLPPGAVGWRFSPSRLEWQAVYDRKLSQGQRKAARHGRFK